MILHVWISRILQIICRLLCSWYMRFIIIHFRQLEWHYDTLILLIIIKILRWMNFWLLMSCISLRLDYLSCCEILSITKTIHLLYCNWFSPTLLNHKRCLCFWCHLLSTTASLIVSILLVSLIRCWILQDIINDPVIVNEV